MRVGAGRWACGSGADAELGVACVAGERDGPLHGAGEREQAGASWAEVWAGAEPCWAGSRDTGPGELLGPREELGRCAPGGPRGELVEGGLGQARVGKVLGRVSETGHGKERGRAGLDWFPGPVFILFLSGLRWVWVRVRFSFSFLILVQTKLNQMNSNLNLNSL